MPRTRCSAATASCRGRSSSAKIPALTGNRVLYRDGIAIAALVAGEIRTLVPLDAAETSAAEHALIRRQPGSPLFAYLR